MINLILHSGMKIRSLPLLESQEDRNGNITRYKRLDRGNILPPDYVKILNIPQAEIVYHEKSPIIKMKHKGFFPKANALLLEQKIKGEEYNSVYTVSYCRIKTKLSGLLEKVHLTKIKKDLNKMELKISRLSKELLEEEGW